MTDQPSPTRRFWLGGKRAAEQDRFFRESLEPLGWQAGDEHDWDTAWITGMPAPEQFRRVSTRCKLNHFPGNAALTVKSRLHDSLVTLRERMHDSHGADSELAGRLAFFPRAYVMPGDYHELQEAALANPGQRWILKPTNASKGKGIRVLGDVAEAPLEPDWLVQEYLANPHTIRGHKYVLRLYVLISSIEPLRVYLYRQGFAKLASEPWDPEDVDNPYSQLTNPDINALNDRAEVPVEFIDLERYRQWLRDQGHDDERLFARIQDLVALTAISGVDAMRRRTAQVGADSRGCYELLGLDCLVDDTLKPWILECNLSPSLGICAAPDNGGRVEEVVKGGLVRDLVSLVDIAGATPQPDDGKAVEAAWLVTEAEAEMSRAGDFEPLLPGNEPTRYLPYFSLPTLADVLLAEGLAGISIERPLLQRRQVAELLDDDQLALYATGSGDYLRPNETATLIWLLATEGLDPDTITEEVWRATSREQSSVPDRQALRLDVWRTLGDWCRAGLLCQQASESSPSSSGTDTGTPLNPPAVPMRSPGTIMQLDFDGRTWALQVGSDPALVRLSRLFGDRLRPLGDETAGDLPRLCVLRDSAGYTLVAGDEVQASRLTLARLGPAVVSCLLRQASIPDRLVLDAGLLLTPGGRAVLCLLPEGDSRAEAVETLSSTGSHLTLGLRLGLTALPRVEPLELPLTNTLAGGITELPETIETLAVLWIHPGEDDRTAPTAMLEVLGALLPGCIVAGGMPPGAKTVSALGEWLSSCDRFSITFGKVGPSSLQLADWLAGLDEAYSGSDSNLMAAANG
jgi:tubulin polyglutamylase TTLL5